MSLPVPGVLRSGKRRASDVESNAQKKSLKKRKIKENSKVPSLVAAKNKISSKSKTQVNKSNSYISIFVLFSRML